MKTLQIISAVLFMMLLNACALDRCADEKSTDVHPANEKPVVAAVTSQEMEAYTIAAEQGDAKAQFNLGVMYGRGEGVQQSYPQAALWLGKAAKQGDVDAQAMLGEMYAEGIGVPQDYQQAYAWLALAAVVGDPDTVINRNNVAAKLTPQGLEHAQQAAAELAHKMQQNQ